MIFFRYRMTHTNTVTPKELCQLVRDAHSRISASIIKTRWSLIFQQSELEILAISNWITSITKRARTQEFLVSSYCISTNPWSQDTPGLWLLQQCHPSSLALSSWRWNRHKSFSLKSFLPCLSNSQPIFNILQEQRTGSFKLRGAHSKLSKMTQREVRTRTHVHF